jgi:putative copper export protein
MTPNIFVSAIVIFLHDLFTAAWIGGLIVIGLTALPAARKVLGKGPQMKQLMDTIMKRQSIVVYLSIVGLTLTGLLQARSGQAFEGLFSFATSYSAMLSLKHLFMFLMVVAALLRSLVLGRAKGRGNESSEHFSAILLYSNLALGIVVLLLSGLLGASA